MESPEQASAQVNQQIDFSIEDFNQDKHLNLVKAWLVAREMDLKNLNNLPEIGFIIYRHDVPVAVSFLRIAEGMMGIYEGLCTNPVIESAVRNAAIDALIQHTIETARLKGMKMMIAWTIDDHCLKRATLKHSFINTGCVLMALDINEPSVH